MITTKNGFKWSKTEDGWRDEETLLVWLPVEPGRHTHYEALKLQDDSKRLPTIGELRMACEHGACEVIEDFKDYWSYSICPDNNDYAYKLDGHDGIVYNADRSSGNKVRMVRK